MSKKQHLIIILPEKLADVPIQIIRSTSREQLTFNLHPAEDESTAPDRPEKRYSFIWRQNDYLKVALNEILWIEADRSYSNIHLSGDRTMTISFNLAVVERELPRNDFVRIHRSSIVNLQHVVSLSGNCLRIDNRLLTIGREYRNALLDRFIFLGVRRSKSG